MDDVASNEARRLEVFAGPALVGTLSEGGGLWTFKYDMQWTESPSAFDLAADLTRATLLHSDVMEGPRPVQHYFDKLFFNAFGHGALPKGGHVVAHPDAFGLLEYLAAVSGGCLRIPPIL